MNYVLINFCIVIKIGGDANESFLTHKTLPFPLKTLNTQLTNH